MMTRTVRLGVLATLLLPACQQFPSLMRRHTYPPDFKYVERRQVRSAMWQLAQDVTELDQVMRRPGMTDEGRRVEVVRLLTAMMGSTAELQTQARPTNHPLLGAHLERFRRDVAMARAAADADPPSYYLVGSVSGACLVCHSPDR